MNLHQIQIVAVPLEDRLLWRVATTDAHEFRVWLTRRMVTGLWPLLLEQLRAATRAAHPASPNASDALLGLASERALAAADFSQPFGTPPPAAKADAPEAGDPTAAPAAPAAPAASDSPAAPAATVYPLGEAPLLPNTVNVQVTNAGELKLSMLPLQGQGFDLTLPQPLVLTTLKLIADAAQQAQWDLTLSLPGHDAGGDAPPGWLN